jgi:hypothetical protein
MTPGFLDSDPQSTARTSGGKVRISEIHWNIASISTHFLVVDAGLARAKAKDCENSLVRITSILILAPEFVIQVLTSLVSYSLLSRKPCVCPLP